MAEKLLMLALSPTMEEGTIQKWNKNEGDTVKSSEAICEVETDKAAMDYESPVEGTLLKIVANEGDTVAVGDLIGVVGEEGEDISDLLKEGGEKPAGDSADTGNTAPGETLEKKEEKPEKPKETETAEKEEVPEGKAPPAPDEGGERVKSSPLARKIAEQKGIDIRNIQGSGPGGRIVKNDVESYEPAKAKGAVKAQKLEQDREVKISGKRKTIAKRLAQSKFQAPHYYLTMSVEMGRLFAARKRLNESIEEKVSLNTLIIKAAAAALKKHPQVNASWQEDSILQFGSADIGLAVAQEDGLITPVIRAVETKGLVELDAEVREMIGKAREGKLSPEQITGAGFSISNLGGFGIEEFTAIINPPASAILALGEAKKVPVADQETGEVKTGTVMKMTMSCDHRVIDGAVGAAFLADLKGMLEEPLKILYY
ncbi:MAG: dihydrolipoamide acetyltransferase family protein [Spirochaetia bacterium]